MTDNIIDEVLRRHERYAEIAHLPPTLLSPEERLECSRLGSEERKLARALKLAMEELQSPVSHGPNGPVYSLKHIDAISDITKILQEP